MAGIIEKIRELIGKNDEEQDEETISYYQTDAFWLTRWIRDWKYKRVGLTTITWMGEDYGYRMEVNRIPKTQIEDMRRSLPYPMHKSNCGWNEWVLFVDDERTPFPSVLPDENGFYSPTAIDLHHYMTNKSLDNALSFKKKNSVPLDGKMLLLCGVAVCIVVFIILRSFS